MTAKDERTPQASLAELWGEIRDLEVAQEVMQWDRETHMPSGGIEGRGQALATVAGIRHVRLCDPRLRDALDACAERAAQGSVEEGQVRAARRVVDRAVKVPADLTREITAASSRAMGTWQAARAGSDFARFRPDLEYLVRLKREEASAIEPDGLAYEALMDEFEPGSRVALLDPLFDALGEALSGLVAAARDSGVEVDEGAFLGAFPRDRQLAFARTVIGRMGFSPDTGRVDSSVHPFCTAFCSRDVRITWRHDDADLRPALFGLMHEAGHALYELGLPDAWQRTPLGTWASVGIHESQSRLWENLVGRGRPFWTWALPRLVETFPDRAGLSVERLWPALHTVRPSLNRVEADETTYNLHVAVRYGLEKALIGGDLVVADLPGAWDDAYERLLGLRPGDPAEGVLQDVHWAIGAFGYFHTYTLGNLIGAQLYEAALDQVDDLEARIARGDLACLREWLRENIHRHGCFHTADELVRQTTGRELGTEAFLGDIRRTAGEIYGI